MNDTIRTELLDTTLHELVSHMCTIGEPSFRARQILSWVHRRLETSPSVMTDLPRPLRDYLQRTFPSRIPVVDRVQTSQDGTTEKFALRLDDTSSLIEAVLMTNEDRSPSLCLSTQVGCKLACRFCHTARGGLERDLATAEIIGQLWLLKRRLRALNLDEKRHSVIFMGMGEPLANTGALHRALVIMSAEWGMGLSPRRVTISTAGIVEGIRWLACKHPQINLALSLNASNDDTRRYLMPSTPRGGIAELLTAVRYHYERTRRLPTLEYVLIRNINDALDHSLELSATLKDLPCLVNLIPLNSSPDDRFTRPPIERVQSFRNTLIRRGIRATIRHSRGDDIRAACGQLTRLPIVPTQVP